MNKLAGLLSLVVALVFVVGASADDNEKGKGKGKGKRGFGDPEQLFSKLDANKDGKLTKDEFFKMADRVKDEGKAEKFKKFLGKAWEKISNGQESVTLEEFKDRASKLKKKKKGSADL